MSPCSFPSVARNNLTKQQNLKHLYLFYFKFLVSWSLGCVGSVVTYVSQCVITLTFREGKSNAVCCLPGFIFSKSFLPDRSMGVVCFSIVTVGKHPEVCFPQITTSFWSFFWPWTFHTTAVAYQSFTFTLRWVSSSEWCLFSVQSDAHCCEDYYFECYALKIVIEISGGGDPHAAFTTL